MGVFSREISQLSKIHPPPPFFEEPLEFVDYSRIFKRLQYWNIAPIPLILVILVPPSEELHKFVAQECHIGKLKCLLLSVITHTLVPFAPTIVSVEATSSTSISIQWNASEKDGGSPITGYVVEYRPTSNPSFETQVVARDVFSTTLDGLTPSTKYDVRVRGENAVGRSVPSATLQTKTDGELIDTIFFQGPTQIAELFKLQEKLLCVQK